ncbi:PKD domain-containing protein [Shewanella abyssi]|uniref:PKD domain-containing protein n=1 Tax=Shewanella abyssi TaxID=311789 RepID=UPI00200C01B5|nr:PKD domain-containing protein [Shewanella abyssi]MCL1050209.1 PKD domain-containing protein [Shewanella abyssi]
MNIRFIGLMAATLPLLSYAGDTFQADLNGAKPSSSTAISCGTDDNGQLWQSSNFTPQQLQRLDAKKAGLDIAKSSVAQLNAVDPMAAENRYYIPVVVHVYGQDIHNCSEGDDTYTCVTDETLIDALNKTNGDIQGLNTLDGPILEQFQDIRSNLNVEFVLAKLDPDGNPTNGIIRHNDGLISGYGDEDIADVNAAIAADAWDNYKYMNVYIQHDLYNDGDKTNSGLAFYPSVDMSDKNLARVVYNGAYLGTNAEVIGGERYLAHGENFRSVLTHEFGHWLNLKHIFWGGSCSPEDALFCGLSGDNICDTPQLESSDTQDNYPNCLGEKTNTENFMHYSDNYAMFTLDQNKRTTAALHHPARRTLWSDDNLIATGLGEFAAIGEHEWDGSGLDELPEGTLLFEATELAADKGSITHYPIVVDESVELLAVFLDNYTQDPDMYVRFGTEAVLGDDDNWTTDFTSFSAVGSPEFVKVFAPNPGTYYATVHAFSEYSNARIRIVALEDPTLCEGCTRVKLLTEDIQANNGDDPKLYEFTIPEAAIRVNFQIPNGYDGDPDMAVKMGAGVTMEEDGNDCMPWSAPGILEDCDFNELALDSGGELVVPAAEVGGLYSVMIDPFLDYSGAKLLVTYDLPWSEMPIANANGPYIGLDAGEDKDDISFSSAGSSYAAGTIESYLWDFGDGSEASEESNPLHSYRYAGVYTAMLSVTNNLGATRVSTAQVTVAASKPATAHIDVAANAATGEAVAFSSESTQAGDAEIVSYLWEFADGSSSDEPNPIHYFAVAGEYEVNLKVTDKKGNQGVANTEVTITEANVKPVAQIDGPYAAAPAETISFNSDESTDSDGEIVAYLWNFGDGTSSDEANPSHAYSAAGGYMVSLTITDNDGTTGVIHSIAVITAPTPTPIAEPTKSDNDSGGTTGLLSLIGLSLIMLRRRLTIK